MIHDARRLSDGHVDGVEATWSHEDAFDATQAFYFFSSRFNSPRNTFLDAPPASGVRSFSLPR